MVAQPVIDWTLDRVQAAKEGGAILGTSGLFGTKSSVQGQALMMMAMSEGLSLTELRRRYHIVNGSELSMRADYMRAEFRRLGGVYKWLNTGDDGKKATLYVKYLDNELEVSYSIEDAQREGLIKKGSRWEKAPGDMLRARVSTKAIRMVCTEVLAGFATDEEIEACTPEPAGHIEQQPAAAQSPIQSQPSAAASEPPATTVQNAVVEDLASPEQVHEIDSLFTAINASPASRSGAMAKRGVSRWEDLTGEQAAELITALRSKLPTSAGVTAENQSGPITAELVKQIEDAIRTVAQTPGGAELNDMVKSHLDKHGRLLHQLTISEGRALLNALETRNVDIFMRLALQQTAPTEGKA